jgi:hypothetical protein
VTRCRFCGGADQWIKTVRTLSGEKVRCCNECYETLRKVLVLVPGEHVVFARCDLCWNFFNPRDIIAGTLRPAGWKEAYGGTCRMCAA